MINGKVIPFKLDTGAEVTAISEKALQSIGKPTLEKSTKQLCGPDKKPLDVLGSFTDDLFCKQQTSRQEVFVVQDLNSNLVGLTAIMALHILVKIESVHDNGVVIKKKVPQLFHRLGTIEGEYEIHLKPDTIPHALFTARHVPTSFGKKVCKELKRMETLEVISKMDVPTDWCAKMVVFPKKNGNICICIDLMPLNESVLQKNAFSTPC